jgi:hypothetical protein
MARGNLPARPTSLAGYLDMYQAFNMRSPWSQPDRHPADSDNGPRRCRRCPRLVAWVVRYSFPV